MGRATTRAKLSAATVVAVMVLAGCGSSAATPAPAAATPAPASVAPAAATASRAPASVAAATPAPTTAAANVDPRLAAATAAFAALKSYQFRTTMSGGSYGSVLGNGIAGTVVNTPTMAVQFTYVDIEVIQSGGSIWQKNGSSWDLANANYPGGKTTFDSFGPPVLFAHDFTPFVPSYTPVGDETVNGVNATHFTCNPKALGFFSGVYGFPGTATTTADVWLARDGGYPVQFEVKASGTATFDLKVVITKANDAANVVKVPAK